MNYFIQILYNLYLFLKKILFLQLSGESNTIVNEISKQDNPIHISDSFKKLTREDESIMNEISKQNIDDSFDIESLKNEFIYDSFYSDEKLIKSNALFHEYFRSEKNIQKSKKAKLFFKYNFNFIKKRVLKLINCHK